MALSNLTGWNEKSATSACGASDNPEEKPAACWADDKPEEKPAAFGSACGAGDKPEEKPVACGSACGSSDKSSSQKERMLMVRSHLDFVQQSIASLDSKLDELNALYENAVSLFCTIPGVDRNSAITIISEIGTDMTQFNSSKRLCCWAGLTPDNNETAGKTKSVRITRAGVCLKPALVQCAHAAIKSTATPYYKNKCERLAKRRDKKRSIIAIERMLPTAVYQMLSTGETWNPCDLYKTDMPQQMQDKQKAKAVKQALKLLISEGVISPESAPTAV